MDPDSQPDDMKSRIWIRTEKCPDTHHCLKWNVQYTPRLHNLPVLIAEQIYMTKKTNL
jgi:hypothetical protein